MKLNDRGSADILRTETDSKGMKILMRSLICEEALNACATFTHDVCLC
jgi:hypothetical protein